MQKTVDSICLSHLRSGCALALLLAAAGCGSSSGGTTSYVCSPGCPAGTHCAETGCVADSSAPDLASGGGNDMAAGCSPACGGGAPYCNPSHQCVPCLVDDNCPAGQQCKTSGSVTACVQGCSSDNRCGASGKCCAGQCVDVTQDPQNCGACGTACMSNHAAASCVAGACTGGACAPGYADCNKDPADGCETLLLTDGNNCGACGASCKFANARAACAGSCYIAACLFGFDDCNANSGDGCETSVLSDAKNCGACGNACQKPAHASVGCVNASCQLTKCDQGFADCDGDPRNGCEVAVGNDKQNCGVCGNQCGQGLVCVNSSCTCPQCNFPNAKSACKNLQCVMGDCLPGYADCNLNPKDGCEVSLNDDAKNCASCGTVCPQNLPSCIGGVCQKIQCMRVGWKFGHDNWDCPQGYVMPTVNDWNNVLPCITPQDMTMFGYYHDVAVSVGGCNCKWNGNWCGQPSIETIQGGRMCGDFNQLQVCISG